MEFIELIMRPQFVVTMLAAISAFVTVLTIALPIMSSDRINQRMKLMATERAKMRAERMADMASERPGNSLRQTPKGYMQEVVDQLNLRKHFDSEGIRAQLKMAGLRGQASDIQIQAEQLRYTKRRMAELIAFHSGKTLEQIQEDSERDRWFTAEEAKEYGLCDSVILRRGEII
mgnify:CR=1 FL=1